jgi:hypothetical protein
MIFPDSLIPSNSVNLTIRQKHAIPLVLAARSIEEGCRSAGINKQTWYNWMKDEGFKEEVCSRREAVISDAFDLLKASITSAVEGLIGLVDCEEKGLRLKACNHVIEYLMRMRETEELEHRLSALEQALRHDAA